MSLRGWFRRWRERRDPRVLVARLYEEGVIDDEMLLAARGRHPSQQQPYHTRALDYLPRRDMDGELISEERWLQHDWVEATTFGDARNGFTRWAVGYRRQQRPTERD